MRYVGYVCAFLFIATQADADWTISGESCSANCTAFGPVTDSDLDNSHASAFAISNPAGKVTMAGDGVSYDELYFYGAAATAERDVQQNGGGIYAGFGTTYGEQYTSRDTGGSCSVYLNFKLAYTAWGGGMKRTTANGSSILWGFGTVKAGSWELRWQLDENNNEVDWELYDGNSLDSSGSLGPTTAGGQQVFEINKVKTLSLTAGQDVLFRSDVFMFSTLELVDSEIQASALHN